MLGSFVSAVVAFGSGHQGLAYALIFVVAAAEALPVVGALVPGDTVLLGISALVATGAVHLGPLMLAATLGAIVGDGFAFWLGRRYRGASVARWPLNRYPRGITRGEEFLRRHGRKSVLIARFTPGVLRLWQSNVRTTAPASPARRVLIGTITEERAVHVLSFLIVTSESADYNRPRERLASAIRIHRLGVRPVALRGPGWDGRVLLAVATEAAGHVLKPMSHHPSDAKPPPRSQAPPRSIPPSSHRSPQPGPSHPGALNLRPAAPGSAAAAPLRSTAAAHPSVLYDAPCATSPVNSDADAGDGTPPPCRSAATPARSAAAAPATTVAVSACPCRPAVL